MKDLAESPARKWGSAPRRSLWNSAMASALRADALSMRQAIISAVSTAICVKIRVCRRISQRSAAWTWGRLSSLPCPPPSVHKIKYVEGFYRGAPHGSGGGYHLKSDTGTKQRRPHRSVLGSLFVGDPPPLTVAGANARIADGALAVRGRHDGRQLEATGDPRRWPLKQPHGIQTVHLSTPERA